MKICVAITVSGLANVSYRQHIHGQALMKIVRYFYLSSQCHLIYLAGAGCRRSKLSRNPFVLFSKPKHIIMTSISPSYLLSQV